MSDKLHLLIPGAVLAPEASGPTAPALPAPLPPNLRALLALLAPGATIACEEGSPATPFELALARANGLSGEPGHIPWAAFETATVGTPCAFIHLCHWQVGADHVMLSPPEDLALDAETANALRAAMAPYFEEDGIALNPYGAVPGVWLATGEPLRTLRTVSLDRLAGQRLTPALLDAAGSPDATLRRLQNEMQMLLYTHPLTEERQRRGLQPVNSFWVTGAGVLDQPPAAAPEVQVETRLAAPALRRDAAGHAQAWQQVDAETCASLLALARRGGPVQLTLCGERAAKTFGPAHNGAWRRFKSGIGLLRSSDGLVQL
ncbi:MAG: phosphoglycerate mutase [Comamonadaceae bacterium]|nr:MAG: phosphoglycerate mutase [Comamonadaceae bacterium]